MSDEHQSDTRTQFERQWETPKKIVFRDGREHDVFDISPAQPTDTHPIIFVEGWNIPGPGRIMVEELTKLGRRVIFMKAAHGIDHPENYIPVSQFPDAIHRISGGVAALIDELDLPKVDVIGHSQGALGVVDAALSDLIGKRIENMVLMNPAGVTEDSKKGLAAHIIDDNSHI